jgi:flagellar hook-associated protein 2
MAISSPGVGSNLDVNTIVSGLMKTEQGPLTLVTKQKTDFQSKISAYGSLKGVLSTFQNALGNLSSVSKFNTQKAESADASVFTATSNGTAVESSYSVKVKQLAQTQKIAMAGETSVNSPIGTGKLTISFGGYDSDANTFTLNANQAVATIDITPENNTLSGIRDAINSANVGVSATIVNDGQSNRLVLSAKNSGTNNSIKMTVNDADGNHQDASGLSKLAFDPTAGVGSGKNLSVLQVAKDAIVDIDGVLVTKASNVITDAVDGITFNLLKEQPATAVTLGVSRDKASIEASVTAFVKAFNDANQVIRDLTKFNETTKTGGALLGDAATRSVASQIKQVMTGSISGAGTLKTLNDIGVSFQRDGTLAINDSKLKAALQNNAIDIPALFAASAKATDSLIKHTGQTDKTAAGTYAVNVTQLATQGHVQGSTAPGLTITQGINDHLDFNIDSVNYSIDLAAGTYNSSADIAAELQTRLSAAGASAKVVLNGSNIQVISANYGATASVMLSSGNGIANLFGAPVTTAGVDAAGTINGVVAKGVGQQLIGANGDASEGLVVQVNGGGLGNRGSVTFSQGYAYQLNKIVKNVLGTDGILTSRTDGINSSITRLTKQQEALQDRLTKIEKRYREQFTSLDTLISSMQQTSSYLTQQIATFQNNN